MKSSKSIEILRICLKSALLFRIILGCVLAFFAPFGTYAFPWLARIAFWVLAVYCGSIFSASLLSLMRAMNTALVARRLFFFQIIVSIVISFPLGAFVYYMLEALQMGLNVQSYIILWLQVLLLTMVLNLGYGTWEFNSAPSRPSNWGIIMTVFGLYQLRYFNTANNETLPQAIQEHTPPPKNLLPARLKDALANEIGEVTKIHWIVSQDHYLECSTDKGTALLLMRMRDAEFLLTDYPGCRIHRSCWIAYASIKEILKKQGKITIATHANTHFTVGNNYKKVFLKNLALWQART